jgi:PAS domain S-box-containing protein
MSALSNSDRLAILRSLGFLDPQPDVPFDRLTRLAARALHLPVTLVTFVSDERQVFLGATGLPEPWATQRETPLSHSFCQHVVTTDQPLIVTDARRHPLVHDNLAIPDIGVIAYAGIPLKTRSGHTLGSFCAIDTQPHDWTSDELDLLRDFAGAALAEIELRIAARETETARHEWQTLLASSGESIYGMDAQGKCTYINEAALAFFGYSASECLGRDLHAVVHDRYEDGRPYPAEECPIYRTLHTGEPARQIEEVFWHKDGHPLPALYSASPLIEHGLVRAVIVTIVDIGERKRAEEWQRFLATSSARLNLSLDYATTLREITALLVPRIADWCAIDLVSEDGQVTRTAFAHADPQREPLLREMTAHYPPAAAEPSPILRTLRSGRRILQATITPAELAALTHDAAHLRLAEAIGMTSMLLVPLQAHGHTFGVLSLVRGTSPPYTAEESVRVEDFAQRCAVALDNARLYQQAQEAVLLRDQFVAIASHELRTPVTSIRGYAQLIERQIARENFDAERITRQTTQIITQATRLTTLIGDLLDASRIQQGRLDLHLTRCDLTALARETFGAFKTAPERTSSHTLILDADEGVVGHWDRGRLDQVLTNLLSNALKYSPAGGEVRLHIGKSGDQAVVTVSDQGIGISQEEQKNLFQPFSRGGAAHGRIGGTGLGLYIVRQIVEGHGGTIAVESAPGQGSTFTLTLPLGDPACWSDASSPPERE